MALIVVVWTAICALLSRHDLDQARAQLAATEASPPANITQLQAEVAHEQSLAASAASMTSQPGPWIFSHIPIVGRSIAAEHTIASAAQGLLQSLSPVITEAQSLSTSGGGGVDLHTLRTLQQDLQMSVPKNAASLQALDSLKFGWTPSFVSRPGEQAVAQLRSAITGLGTAGQGVAALRGILGGQGKRTVMVALENNAELRGTGGLVSSFALGTAQDGKLRLGKFRDINSIAKQPAQATSVPAPKDYESAYGKEFLANTTLWRNANMSADVPESAQVMSELMERSLHVRPSVIIFVDVPAMTRIIEGTGHVVTLPDGSTVGGSQLENALLVQSYGKATYNEKQESERKAQLDDAAGQVFAQVSSKKPTLGLLKALASAASERHIILWSSRPDEERALEAAGIAGQVDAGSGGIAMVTGQNLGDHPGFGNKLDYYIRRSLSFTAQVGLTSASVTETLTMDNQTPTGLGPYIVGPDHPGRLKELLGMALPSSATITDFSSDGHSVPSQVLPADGTREIRVIADIPRGQTQSWTLTYTMPLTNGQFSLLGIPQPLAVPASFDVRIEPTAGVGLSGVGSTVTSNNVLTRSGPWNGLVKIAVQAHQPGLLARAEHKFASFWSHKVTLSVEPVK